MSVEHTDIKSDSGLLRQHKDINKRTVATPTIHFLVALRTPPMIMESFAFLSRIFLDINLNAMCCLPLE